VRNTRSFICIDDKLAHIEMRDAGRTWPEILALIWLEISASAAGVVLKDKERF